MSDFPRGWILPVGLVNGPGLSVTAPAVPGVIHVLDDLTVKAYWASGTPSAVSIAVQIVMAPFGTVTIDALLLPAALFQSSESQYSGLDMASSAGGSIVVQVFGAGASVQGLIVAQGHDI